MDEQTKEAWKSAEAQAEHTADYLLVRAVTLPHTWVILLGYGLICAFIGGWIRGGFC